MGTFSGVYKIENCSAGSGSCEVDCATPACTATSWMAAYANFTECGTVNCPSPGVTPNVPKLTAAEPCGNYIGIQTCHTGGAFYAGRLWDCKGVASTGHGLVCSQGGSQPVFGSVNNAMFISLCGGTSSCVKYGTGYGTVSAVS